MDERYLPHISSNRRESTSIELWTRQDIERWAYVSRTTFWRWRSDPTFPLPCVKNRWVRAEVEQWVLSQR